MNGIYKKALILIGVALVSVFSINSVTGPAQTYNAAATGAPFDGQTCTGCHGTGSNYSATATLQILSGSTVVSSSNPIVTGNYVPGWTYTVRISRTAAATLPANGGWGFQVTAATTPGNIAVNTWGLSLPAGTHKTTLNGRNYVEHGAKIAKTTSFIDIPWTAPASGTGAVKFYVAVNTVDGGGNSNNDQVVSTSLTMNQAPLPITWMYFRGKEYGQANILEWATTNDKDNSFFTLEKSEDGSNYYELARITSQQKEEAVHTYSYTDNTPLTKTHYRIKQTDISGKENYFRTIQIVKESLVTASHSIVADQVIVKVQSEESSDVSASLYNLNGKIVSSENYHLVNGSNLIKLQKPALPGLYFLSLKGKDKIIYQAKVLVSQ